VLKGRGLLQDLSFFSHLELIFKKIPGGKIWRTIMITIYDNGEIYEIDEEDIYDPFPDEESEDTEELA